MLDNTAEKAEVAPKFAEDIAAAVLDMTVTVDIFNWPNSMRYSRLDIILRLQGELHNTAEKAETAALLRRTWKSWMWRTGSA